MSYAQHSSSIEAIEYHAIRYPPAQRSIQRPHHTPLTRVRRAHRLRYMFANMKFIQTCDVWWFIQVFDLFVVSAAAALAIRSIATFCRFYILSRSTRFFSLAFFRCAFFAFIRLLVVEYIINDDYLFYYYMIDYFIRSHILLYVVLNKETINSTFFSWLLSPFREQFFFVFCFSLCSVFLLLIFFSFSASKLEMVAVVCAELLFR